MDKSLCFTGAYRNQNWFYNKYYYNGANGRFDTFNLSLNILNQKFDNPVIVETGCQRQKDDVGAGMSTSIFAEYINKYGGSLVVIDNVQRHLDIAKQCVSEWPNVNITWNYADSIKGLSELKETPDLVYLDSFDYPIDLLLNKYIQDNREIAFQKLWSEDPESLIQEFQTIIAACQEHCVKEFEVIENKLHERTLLLLDDNLLPGGGKPRLLKELLPDKGWICLLDSQQSLWIRSI